MSRVDPLTPWADELAAEDAHHPPLSRLMGAVPEPSALSETSRQRVALRLRAPTSRRAGLTLLRVVAVGAVIGLSGAAFAQWASEHVFGTPVARQVRVQSPKPALAPQPAVPKWPSPAREQTEVPVPVVIADRSPVTAFPAAPPAASSRLGREAASLEAALSTLHGGGASRRQEALKALEQHLHDFPGGPLELEARVARVDALLALGRRQDARRELSALPLENVGRKNELRLIRAELRADDDCRAARPDFQVLLGEPLPAAFAERALFGRGACSLKLGDRAGAERDFAAYLERFPEGRFASQIRAQEKR